ncbi:MAG: PAS domain-containing protein [Campylobacterales bacterium]|nr:PAS domain-containing protein [Campylobacterales bacterium]
MNPALKPYLPVCEAIGKLFAPNVEVVLHDLETKTLVFIANAFTKRRAGDAMLSHPQLPKNGDWVGPYDKSLEECKALKAVSIILRDEQEKPIGMLCINYDITPAKALFESLKILVSCDASTPSPGAFFSQNWKEHTDELIAQFLSERNVALQGLSTNEKRELAVFLEAKGTFAIRNALGYVCGVLSVSRATIYNWLKQQREA